MSGRPPLCNSRSPVSGHNQETSCDKKYLNANDPNLPYYAGCISNKIGYEIEAAWVQLGEILYLTIAGEAKGLAIAASDCLLGLVSFGYAQGKMLKI